LPAGTFRTVVALSAAFQRLAHAHEGVFLYRRGHYGRTPWLEADSYKFVFVPEGRYGVQVNDHELGVAPGQFVVLNPHARHRHLGLSGSKLLVEVRPEAIAEAAAALGRPRPPRFRQLRASDSLVHAWVREWIAASEESRDLEVGEIVAGIALRLVELHDEPPRFRATAAVAKAVALINERFSERLTLDELAAEAGMERFAFAHAFRRETGLSPHAYLRERRLAAAAAALAGSTPIIDVAFDCGFGSVSSFNRAFRAAFGVAPSRYRELHARSIVRGN
jgi:AraC family transcriptional regulator